MSVECRFRVNLRARFAGWRISGALDVWSLKGKSPGTVVTLPSLDFSGVSVFLSSNSSLELKLAPIILFPEVTLKFLSEHKHSLCGLSPRVIALQIMGYFFRSMRLGALIPFGCMGESG